MVPLGLPDLKITKSQHVFLRNYYRMFILLSCSCPGGPYGRPNTELHRHFFDPVQPSLYLTFFFFLSLDIFLNPTHFYNLCNLPKCSLLHFFYKVILPTTSSPGYLMTISPLSEYFSFSFVYSSIQGPFSISDE